MSTQTDIANVAMQLLGAQLIPQGTLFTATTKNAVQAAACYDTLRESELRRNPWVFATRRVCLRPINIGFEPGILNQAGNPQYPTLLLNPATWSATGTYPVGSVTQYQGLFYINRQYGNTNWSVYYGPTTVQPYDTTGNTAYLAGELVYDPFSYPSKVYLSLINQPVNPNQTQIAPSVAVPAWSATTEYNQGDAVTKSAVTYVSNVVLNLNNDPAATPATFNIGTTYAATNKVVGSDFNVYQSIGSGNVGNDPTLDNGVHWTFLGPSLWVVSTTASVWQNGSWLYIADAGLTQLNIQYPLGTGPTWDTYTKNIFALPSGFLCEAKDQKAPRWTNDWDFENGYIVAGTQGPVIFRFIADIRDTSQFDPMFVYGLGARIGEHLSETMTNASGKKRDIGADYNRFMAEARLKNAIETGFSLPDEDDWLAVKVSGAYSPTQFP